MLGANKASLSAKANWILSILIFLPYLLAATAMSKQQPPKLNPRKIYVKNIVFESPESPAVFQQQTLQPEIEMNINIETAQIDQQGHFYEVVLQVTARATKDQKNLFLCEIKQAGVFEMHAEDAAQKELLLQVGCPHVLLPFAREEIATIVTKGGFSQLLIAPINFESIYRQSKANLEMAAASQSTH